MGCTLVIISSLIFGCFAVFLTFYKEVDFCKLPFLEKYSNSLFWCDHNHAEGSQVFTKEELSLYDGSEGSKGLYLAILGKVYDVSKGEKHYGPGGGYHGFAGRDGSRAFISGNFKLDGLIDDLEGLEPKDILDLQDWAQLYVEKYKYIGLLCPTFYDCDGRPTAAYHRLQATLSEGRRLKDLEQIEKEKFPPCNSEWSDKAGGRVWCSDKSGGIHRDWVGVPRRYHTAGKTNPRCVCVRTSGAPSSDPQSTSHDNRGDLDNPHLAVYENCPLDSDSCRFQ